MNHELKLRYRTARKDCLHFTAQLLKLIADERWGDVVQLAETLGDRATEAKVMKDAIREKGLGT